MVKPNPEQALVPEGNTVPNVSELPVSQAIQASANLTGKTLGDFHILRVLGFGGMGQVYLAEQVSLKRQVALKILKPELASNPTYLQRFRAEAEVAARATHANIVQVYAIGEAQGCNYMALEYVEGKTLKDYLSKKGTIEPALALTIMRQVASALQRAAELGIVHRDIKPENILLTRKGEVKVADFGLSRDGQSDQLHLTQTGQTMGTPLYMSPEQVQGQTIDARSDMYSFGVMCYHMLAGQPPFRGKTAYEIAIHHVKSEPEFLLEVRPDLPEPLCSVVHKMMEKNPADRYQTPRDLLKDLTTLREVLASSAPTEAHLANPVASPNSPRNSGVLSAPSTKTKTLSTSTHALPATNVGSSWMIWLAIAAGLLSFCLGSTLGTWYFFLRPGSGYFGKGSGPGPGTRVDWGDLQLPAPPDLSKKQEQQLREQVEKFLKQPDDKRESPRVILSHSIALSLQLVEQRRLEEAQEFFCQLEELGTGPELDQFRILGRLGKGVVSAYENKTQESLRQFEDVLAPRPMPGEAFPPKGVEKVREFMQSQPRVRDMIVQAIKHNERNLPAGEGLHPGLERFRRESLPPFRPNQPLP